MSGMARTSHRNGVEMLSPKIEVFLFLSAVFLLLLGLVMVASSSMHLGERYGNIYHFFNRHVLAIVLGVVAAVVVTQIAMRWWEKMSTNLFFIGLLLLILVLIPGIGKEVNGAVRWIPFGSFNVQPAEYIKLLAILYLSGYLVRREIEVRHSTWAFVKPLILLVFACLLLMMQPDFGTATVLLITAFGMLFIGGAALWQFGALLGLAILSLTALVMISPYRMSRVTSFLDPWSDPLNSGYQLAQALIAFGRGEWFGVGLGNGIQKQFYLPEAHTDFLMAVIGEELGLFGTLLVIAVFGVLVWRIFLIGTKAELNGDRFSAYVAYGLGLWIGLQAFINVGVNIGLLPTKGLTLPFMSYGSNSIIVCIVSIGILFRIHSENQEYETENNGSNSSNGGGERWLSA